MRKQQMVVLTHYVLVQEDIFVISVGLTILHTGDRGVRLH